ncbi:MAG: hypothetical protein QM576_22595 [Rhodopseudomonas sp.]|uniref:hypothetical protein n=1 Tax=Rhodopseudomonas sp. TaxID=1078 RepID=UPI0039E44C87
MASRIADEREQRRGLILGLSLAEVLLLLLFLLLLLLGYKVQQSQERAKGAEQREAQLSATLAELKPLQQALVLGGAPDVANIQLLIARLQSVQKLERELAAARDENAELSKQSSLIKSLGLLANERRLSIENTMKRAAEIEPNDPPAVLKRAMDVLDRLGAATVPEQVKPLSQMVAGAEADKKIAELEANNDRLTRERNNLMRSGNGLTYPSCWTTSAGQTEYIFDVTLTDGGLRVKDATPARAHDAAWAMVASFPRGAEINESTFISSTKGLFEWSKQQSCRFYTIIRDATGPTNKVRYKKLRRMVEGSFYPFIAEPTQLPAQDVSPPPPPTPAISSAPVQLFPWLSNPSESR